MNTENKVTLSQLSSIIFVLGVSLKMLVLPVLLIKSSNRDAVISMAMILVLELLCLAAVIAAVILSPDKSFTELAEGLLGKVAAKIFYGIIVVFFFIKLMLLAGEVRIFVSENLFAEYHWSLYAFPMCALCAFIAMGTVRAIGRLSQFMIPVIVAATVMMFCMVGTGIDYTGIFPLAEKGMGNALRDMLDYSMWHGDYTVLVVFIGSLKRSRKTALFTLTTGVLSSLGVLFFGIMLTASFATVAEYVRFGQNMSGMANLSFGNVLQGRFDLLFFCVWMISVFIKAGLFSFGAVHFFREIVPCPRPAAAFSLAGLLYIVSVGWQSASGLHAFMIVACSVAAFIVQITVPAFALIAAAINKGKNGKTKNREGAAEEEEIAKSEPVSGADCGKENTTNEA